MEGVRWVQQNHYKGAAALDARENSRKDERFMIAYKTPRVRRARAVFVNAVEQPWRFLLPGYGLLGVALLGMLGCAGDLSQPELIWGRREIGRAHV